MDRLFEKQAKYEEENEEFAKKNMEEWLRQEWLRKRRRHEFPNGPLAKMRRWLEDRKSEVAAAKLEAREIQKHLNKRDVKEYREILKQGVLEGAIQIHETDYGFMIDTPSEEVEQYVLQHPKVKTNLPKPNDLEEGRFLLGTIHDLRKEQTKLVRNSLINEFNAETPSDFMLIDLAVSNYIRAMYATRMEMESLYYTDHYSMEMLEAMSEAVQPYIHSCQNQLVKILRALKAGRQPERPPYAITHQTYSRTDINLENWGVPLLLALAEITGKKEREIGIDEIKLAMTKYVQRLSVQSIPNSWIGYALRQFGFTEKVHVIEGNRYNIERARVLTLLNEDLKA